MSNLPTIIDYLPYLKHAQYTIFKNIIATWYTVE